MGLAFLLFVLPSCQFAKSTLDYPVQYYNLEEGKQCFVSRKEIVRNLYADFKESPLSLRKDQRCKQWKNCWVCRGEGNQTYTVDHFKDVDSKSLKVLQLNEPKVFLPAVSANYGMYFSNYFGQYGMCGDFKSLRKFSKDLSTDLMAGVRVDEMISHFISKCDNTFVGRLTDIGNKDSTLKITCNATGVFTKKNISDIKLQESGELVDKLTEIYKVQSKGYANLNEMNKQEMQGRLAKEIRLALWRSMVSPFKIKKIFENKAFVNINPACNL